MNQFCAIGLKLLAAAGVGVAVYFGIDKAVSRCNKNGQQEPKEGEGNVPGPQHGNCPVNQPDVIGHPNSGEKIVSGLKVAQDVFGRAFSLCQNLAMAADNIVRIFGNNNQGSYSYSQPVYNDPYYNGYQDKYKDPPGYRRLSPFIIEYVGGPVDNRNYCRMY